MTTSLSASPHCSSTDVDLQIDSRSRQFASWVPAERVNTTYFTSLEAEPHEASVLFVRFRITHILAYSIWSASRSRIPSTTRIFGVGRGACSCITYDTVALRLTGAEHSRNDCTTLIYVSAYRTPRHPTINHHLVSAVASEKESTRKGAAVCAYPTVLACAALARKSPPAQTSMVRPICPVRSPSQRTLFTPKGCTADVAR